MERGISMAYMKKRVSFFMRILLCLIAAGLFIFGFYMLVVQYQTATSHIEDVAGQSLQEKQHGRVLFLSSYSQTHFSVPLQWQGIDKGLKGTGVSFDTEYMDMKNHSDPASVERFRDMLAGKLAHTSYDALIVGDDAALHFAEHHRLELFHGLPVVFLGINDLEYAEQVHKSGWATGIPEESNFADIFATAVKLFPTCHTLVCFVDNTATGQGDLAHLQQIMPQFMGYDFVVINTSELTQAELIERLEALDEHTLLFELDAFEDKDGHSYTIDDMCRLLDQYASRPIFRVSTGGVGSGALCSGFLDFEQFGQEAATMALQLMQGASVSDMPLVHQTATHYVFDARQMQKFGLTLRDLPENSTLLNEQVPFWLKYKAILFPVVLIALAFICIILALVITVSDMRHTSLQLQASRQALMHQLYYDRLTGLITPKGFFRLDAEEYDSACALNIDDFKFVNEKYGYPFGDELLKALAERLRALTGARAARVSGDEFFVLFREDITAQPEKLERMAAQLQLPYTVQQTQLDISISLGVAARRPQDSLNDLLTSAELAIYHGRKHRRHAGCQLYDEQIRQDLDRREQAINDLKKAVREKNFTILYQPQVITATKEVYGFEALCRFPDNRYYPDQFIPLAEESGLIIDLDRIVTEKVIQQLDAWRKAGKKLPVVSINYSAHQLKDDAYTRYVAALLQRYDIPADRIKIEITECSVFADQERSAEFFREVHDMGMDIALDDFGTGYSSLTAMKQLPVDFVKFDKSLIDEYLLPGKVTFLANLAAIVHDLGRQIVAEGVETEAQYQLARELGLDQIQGYYFAKPLPGEKAMDVSFQ